MAIDLYKNRCSVYEGDEPYIFVSYSHRDAEKVVSLIRKLRFLGFRVWYDSGVPAGAEWPEEIAVHLQNSGCILSLLSSNAAQSRHFKEEFNYAYYLNKPILVAYLENCDLTPGIEMRVVSQQCIKCEHCEDDEDLLEEIARAKILRPCLGKKPDAAPESISAVPETRESNTKIDLLLERAKAGDPKAQFELACAYIYGEDVPKDESKAAEWFQRAAVQNHVFAQVWLAILYHDGRGVPKDLVQAAFWYQKAADQGDPVALNNLGWSYEAGEGVEIDLEKAVSLYRRSSDNSCDMAMYNMGRVYEYGIFVEQNWEEAVRWYAKAAERNQPWSQKKLIQCYREGLGVPIDEDEAARWQKLYDENPNK